MKEIIRFIEDANEAFYLFSHHIKAEITNLPEGGITIQWEYDDFYSMYNENGEPCTLNEIFQLNGLFQRYGFVLNENTDTDEDTNFINNMASRLKDVLFKCNTKEQREYLINNIISSCVNLIIASDYKEVYRLIIEIGSYNEYDKEEDKKEALGVIDSAKITYFLLDNAAWFFMDLYQECKAWKINLIDAIQNVVNIQGHTELINRGLFPFLPKQYEEREQHKESNEMNITKKNGTSRNEFTLARKKEAILAMLEALGVKQGGIGGVPSTDIQRFIYFLVGEGTAEDNIKNKSVANLFKASNDTRNASTINNDLDYVAARFESVGLYELAQKVRNGKS